MKPITVTSTVGMSREDWLAYRKRGIGGSDIAAIVGLIPRFRTAIDVWLDKTGRAEDRDTTEQMYWGTRLEDIVAEEFSVRTGLPVRRRNAILQRPDYPWMLANIDREVLADDGRRVLECKTTSAYNEDDWREEAVPLSYQAQVQWYLAVTGYQIGYIAVLIGGNTFRWTRIERDEEVIASLIAAGAAFWRHVESDIMPAVDGSQACAETLAGLYPQSVAVEPMPELPPTYPPLLDEYDRLRAEIAERGARVTEIENLMKKELGETEAAWCGARKVSWKTYESARVDSKRLKAEYPEVAAAVTTTSTARRFTITKERK